MTTDVQAITDERGSRYGDLGDNAEVIKSILDTCNDAIAQNISYIELTSRERAMVELLLSMIAGKIARMVCGDPLYVDNFVDIEGYTKRTREILHGEIK